jgi:hypothetical protein
MTLIIPRDASLIGDLLNPFTKSWVHCARLRGLALYYNNGNGRLGGFDGTNDLFSRDIEGVTNGVAFRLGCRCDPTNANQSEVYVNGYRFFVFSWNRSASAYSANTWTALGLIALDAQQYGYGFAASDFWLAEGFQTKRIMELMGGY